MQRRRNIPKRLELNSTIQFQSSLLNINLKKRMKRLVDKIQSNSPDCITSISKNYRKYNPINIKKMLLETIIV